MYKVLLFIFVCTVLLIGCGKNEVLLPDGTAVRVELAQTQEETELGLMYRETLGENEGMLFIFPEDDFRLFWMKNTLIDLDMIFIDSTGEIINIADKVPHSYIDAPQDEIATAGGFGKYVLEVNAGFAIKHNLHQGDKLIINVK